MRRTGQKPKAMNMRRRRKKKKKAGGAGNELTERSETRLLADTLAAQCSPPYRRASSSAACQACTSSCTLHWQLPAACQGFLIPGCSFRERVPTACSGSAGHVSGPRVATTRRQPVCRGTAAAQSLAIGHYLPSTCGGAGSRAALLPLDVHMQDVIGLGAGHPRCDRTPRINSSCCVSICSSFMTGCAACVHSRMRVQSWNRVHARRHTSTRIRGHEHIHIDICIPRCT